MLAAEAQAEQIASVKMNERKHSLKHINKNNILIWTGAGKNRCWTSEKDLALAFIDELPGKLKS